MRARAWAATYFYDSWEGFVEFGFWCHANAKYFCIGFEKCPTTGKDHLQCYLYFENQRTFKSLHKQFHEIHWEAAFASPQKNIEYCSKTGNWYEYGVQPDQGRACFEKVKEAMASPSENFHIFHQYRKAYKEYLAVQETRPAVFYLATDDFKCNYSDYVVPIKNVTDIFDYPRAKVAIVGDNHMAFLNYARGLPIRKRVGYEDRVFDGIVILDFPLPLNPLDATLQTANITRFGRDIKKCSVVLDNGKVLLEE